MPIQNFTRYATKAISILAIVLTGCSASHELSRSSLSRNAAGNPEFLDDITLPNGHTRSGMQIAAADSRRSKASLNPAISNTLQVKYASLMNVLPQAISNMSLYNFIDEWYGVRYRLGGVDKNGIDCSAFVQRLYENVFGMNLVRTAFEQFNTCKLIWDSASLKEGDLVFFRIHSRRISHVGIYLMNNFFVHASSSRGVMISYLGDDYWQRYFAGAGRVM